MRVLGLDPGSELTGFAVLDSAVAGSWELVTCGVIRTPRDLSDADRLGVLGADLRTVLTQYGPFDLAGVEKLFFARNVTTAMQVGQARGVILFTLAEDQITIVEITPAEIKMAMTGSGNANKHDLQKMVQLTFGLATPPQPDDAADAVAIALTAGQLANQPH
jgi:crossover junction endodeoxyribonuclease RuvC